MKFLKRFFKAKGSLRFKILYAIDYEKDLEERTYYVCENIEAGVPVTISRFGYIYKK